MKNNYTIILFKNKVRYKIFKKYTIYSKAQKFYENILSENKKILFDVKKEGGKKVKYEISLITNEEKNINKLFKTDDLGRNLLVELEEKGFNIIKIDDFKFEEKIYHVDNKEKINFSKFLKSFCGGKNLKMFSKLNNKIIAQEEEKLNLFTCKDSEDANRFLETLRDYLIFSKRNDCLIVNDSDVTQKKYLYNLMMQKGYNKKMLYRTSTTHSKDR